MTTVGQALDRPLLHPVPLCEITPVRAGAPKLYLSNRNITVGGQTYEAYLDTIEGLSDELKRLDSSFRNADITIHFLNDRYATYTRLIELSDMWPLPGAEVLIKRTYLDAAGAPSADETLFKGALDEPRGISLKTFSCQVSSMPHARDRRWKQAQIDRATYPNAWDDIGKYEPIIYGANILVPALRIDWGAKSTLQTAIDAVATTIVWSNASLLPEGPWYFWVDDELIYYAAKSGPVLTGCIRGVSGSAAVPHSAGATVWEYKTAYDSLLAGHELHSVGDIYAEIQGELWRVTAGVSAVLEGGKHKLRAVNRIGVQAVNETITVTDSVTVSQGAHSHNVNAAAVPYWGSGASHTSDSGLNITWSGADVNMIDQSGGTGLNASMSASNRAYFTAGFPSYGGPAPSAVYACINYSASGTAANCSVNFAGTEIGLSSQQVKKIYIGTSVPGSLQLQGYYNGNGGGMSVTVYEIWYEVQSGSTSIDAAAGVVKTGTVIKSGGIVATHMVDRFHAAVNGYKSPSTEYGTIGSIMERPDYVIRHFLTMLDGFPAGDIASASFAAAGAQYATAISGGYKFAFRIGEKIVPTEFLRQLADECRSALRYVAGQWLLDYLPDEGPEPVKTISAAELAGEHAEFVFDYTPIDDICNELTARFAYDYSQLGSASEWLGTAGDSVQQSIDKYGPYHEDIDLQCVRSQAMADHLVAFKLLQRKDTLLVCMAQVFWEHWDLSIGQTFAISNPLYNGYRFFVELVTRDGAVASVRAISWWLPSKLSVQSTGVAADTVTETQTYNSETVQSTGTETDTVADNKQDVPPASGWGHDWGDSWNNS